MSEAGGPSTDDVCRPECGECARPTGVVMVAPQTILRKAGRSQGGRTSEAKAKGRAGRMGNTRARASLAITTAPAAQIQRELFYLFASLRVRDHLAYRHPTAVAAGALVMIMIGCCMEGIAGWRYSVLVHRT